MRLGKRVVELRRLCEVAKRPGCVAGGHRFFAETIRDAGARPGQLGGRLGEVRLKRQRAAKRRRRVTVLPGLVLHRAKLVVENPAPRCLPNGALQRINPLVVTAGGRQQQPAPLQQPPVVGPGFQRVVVSCQRRRAVESPGHALRLGAQLAKRLVIVEPMIERRLLQPPNNAGQHHAAIPVGVSQTPGTLAGRQPRAAWFVAARREPRRDALGKQLGQAVVSLERKMHVLVKRLAPGNTAWALRVERGLGVDESHVAGSRLAKRLGDRVQFRVGAKTQRVQVARPNVVAVCLASFALRLE